MRDIVNSNGFNSAATNTKITAKVTNPPGTLTKTDYRSYRDFLGSYGDNNKNSKDDQESVSSNESGISSSNLSESKSNNTSTSSLNSEINGQSFKNLPKNEQPPNTGVASRTGSFRNYLESYNNKKFSSVKPVPLKQNIIKSEIVIQVNDPLDQQQPVFVTTINGDDDLDSIPPPPKSLPPNGYYQQKGYSYLPPPPPLPAPLKQDDLPHEEEGESFFPPPPPPLVLTNDECCAPPPPPPPPKFPEFNNNNNNKSGGKKWDTIATNTDENLPKPKIPPANHAAATNLAKILTQHLLPRKLELEKQLNEQALLNKPNSPPPSVPQNAVKIEKKILVTPTPSPQPPPLPKLSQNGNYNTTSSISFNPNRSRGLASPPPLPKMDYCTLPRRPQKITMELGSIPKLPRSSPPPPSKIEIPKQFQNIDLPSPPKLPQSPPPKMVVNSSGSVDFNTTTVVPINDTTTKVSKNDPNVRKLVYNTYRGLLGAYNNKANDMIATLPRSRVREDQGVSKQLESIALQGGLEKLNGRTNPNVEQDEVHNQ